jgi:hypothetical protein
VMHGNAGVASHGKSLTYEAVQNVVSFLRNYAENNALILSGRITSINVENLASLKLLPSSDTKRGLHSMYMASCDGKHDPVSESSFRRIWKQVLPNIVIQRPRSDLCLTCQQSKTK